MRRAPPWLFHTPQFRHNQILSELFRLQSQFEKGFKQIMALLDDIQGDVTAQTTVVQSVVALIKGLADQIAAAGTDPIKLQAIEDQLRANTQALADSVAANTPAA